MRENLKKKSFLNRSVWTWLEKSYFMSIAIKASYEICLKIQMAQIEPVDSNVDFGRENSKSNTNTIYS